MFSGLTQQSLNFLQDVYLNNSKTWFEDNRAIYETQLVTPFRALVEALTPTMLQIDEWFETKPAIGKTISRIHRDTRFSHDKSRYREHYWLVFKRSGQDWKASPCYFFEISPYWYRYGLGYYSANKQTMDIFRQEVKQNPTEFLTVSQCCEKPFELVGEMYKRPLIKDLPVDIANWYNRKNITVMATCEQLTDLFDANIVDMLSTRFSQLAPLYHYLMRVEFIKNIPSE